MLIGDNLPELGSNLNARIVHTDIAAVYVHAAHVLIDMMLLTTGHITCIPGCHIDQSGYAQSLASCMCCRYCADFGTATVLCYSPLLRQ